jgi:hypothetical protein
VGLKEKPGGIPLGFFVSQLNKSLGTLAIISNYWQFARQKSEN